MVWVNSRLQSGFRTSYSFTETMNSDLIYTVDRTGRGGSVLIHQSRLDTVRLVLYRGQTGSHQSDVTRFGFDGGERRNQYKRIGSDSNRRPKELREAGSDSRTEQIRGAGSDSETSGQADEDCSDPAEKAHQREQLVLIHSGDMWFWSRGQVRWRMGSGDVIDYLLIYINI